MYTYLGCYKNPNHFLDTGERHEDRRFMSARKCVRLCGHKYEYAGTEVCGWILFLFIQYGVSVHIFRCFFSKTCIQSIQVVSHLRPILNCLVFLLYLMRRMCLCIVCICNSVECCWAQWCRFLVKLIYPYCVFLLVILYLWNTLIYTPNNIWTIKMHICSIYQQT